MKISLTPAIILFSLILTSAYAQPIIEVWDGNDQQFGHLGKPQDYINILGDVSGPYSISSLKYSLNGEPNISLSMGPDGRRLKSTGDFNIDIAWDALQDGNNLVVITAVDSNSDTTTKNITVDFNSPNTWALPYTADWNQTSKISDLAQIIDGNWAIEGNSVRTIVPGYDRLIGMGDVTWTDYDVLVPVTIHTMSGGGVGVLFGWHGHTDDPVSGWQPKSGWFPLGAITWYRPGGLEIYGNGGGILASKSMSISTGMKYWYRCRVESVQGQGSYYSMKVWPDGTAEPNNWDVIGQGGINDPCDGGMMLITHQSDVSFGKVTITPIGIKNINVEVNDTNATISWNTNQPSDSNISYGLSSSYTDSEANAVLVTDHNITLKNLTPNTLYHYMITSEDGNGVISSTSDRTFQTTGPDISGIVSDDFDTMTLDTNLWTFVDHVGDCNYGFIGAGSTDAWLQLFVPAGVDHDPWDEGNRAVRIMQDANNVNFEVEVKFESLLTQTYQIEGVFIQEDVNNFLRFDFNYKNGQIINYVASFIDLTPSTRLNSAISPTNTDADPIWMKIKREGNQWTQWYSNDGNNWIQTVTFTHNLNVTSVGPFAGNATDSSSPAFTCNVDYFFNTDSPVVPEDSGTELPPILETIGDQNMLINAVLDVNIHVYDPCGQAVVIIAQNLPVFADFNDYGDGNALLHLEPNSNDAGTYFVTVRATDPCGLYDEETFSILVKDINEQSGIASDDFSSGILNTSIWTYIDTEGDGNLAFSGAGTSDAWAEISVPSGSEHQVWTYGTKVPHILQTVNDVNFQVEVKFESALTQQFQEQGIFVKQDENNFIRFEFYSTASKNYIYCSTFNPSNTQKINSEIDPCAPRYMRVKRDGDSWTQTYSDDGQNWSDGAIFDYAITVNSIAVYAGNAGSNPAHTAKIDYFFNTASPITPEDPCVPPAVEPNIYSIAPTTATTGALYQYDVDANGNPQPSYLLVEAPNDMDINSVTGLISWTPILAGDFNVTVEANNIAGSDQQSFTINVIEPPLIEGLALSPSGCAFDNDNLICDFNLSGSATTAAIAWYVNDMPHALLYLPMEGGDTNAPLDYSGNANDGATAMASNWLATGGYNSSGTYEFSASGNTEITIGQVASPNSPFTKTAWFKLQADTNQAYTIIGDDDGNDLLWVEDQGSGLKLYASLNDANISVPNDVNIAEGLWYFASVTFDYNDTFGFGDLSLSLYDTNDNSYTTLINSIAPLQDYDYVYIGGKGSSDNFNGIIDDVRIYDSLLSIAQIEALMDEPNIIIPGETEIGQTWYCEVTPFSSTKAGNTVISNSAVICPDGDGDGIPDANDNCPAVHNPDQNDVDSDNTGDLCDNCWQISNPDQNDLDTDGIGDECECSRSNIDGTDPINLIDLARLASNWMDQGIDGDTNLDGIVDENDLAQLVQWWLNNCN